MRKGRFIVVSSVVTLILLIVLVMAIDTISTGWKVTTTEKTIDVWSNCKTADKTGGGPDVFAPTKTAAEWTAFIANKPASVTLGSCGPDCNWVTDTSEFYWESSCNLNEVMPACIPALEGKYFGDDDLMTVYSCFSTSLGPDEDSSWRSTHRCVC